MLKLEKDKLEDLAIKLKCMCDCVALITEQAGNCYSESVEEDFAKESRVEAIHLKILRDVVRFTYF